ncbi:MAG: Biotin synthase [Bacteroidetes bacterium ADurb.Bin408]|nr:MAG: Biotin synthase [Bacteroidetes bacterium ADurb.Bin408]
MINQILNKTQFSKQDILTLLSVKGDERTMLFEKSASIKQEYLGNKVYLRGLIELSNICNKNCYYCGIRKDNKKVNRYNLNDTEVLNAAKFAYENKFGSIVIQSGEIQSETFTKRILYLLRKINEISQNKLGITLSLGEQNKEVYKKWFEAGAHRYLLRIETSDRNLYHKLHPNNDLHSYDKRLEALTHLKEIGYQTGTGVMIGLPYQTLDSLADDLLFMKHFDIDMCGMGPYIEHADTPLYANRDALLPVKERFEMTMKMVALLRIMMKDINIAATTALQAIDKVGREKIIKIGANILMPNITPGKYRDSYTLYQGKPCTDENADDCKNCIEARIKIAGAEVAYSEWGDSPHFKHKH